MTTPTEAPAEALRPATSTAERERLVLQRTADRSGPGRVVALAAVGLRRLGTTEAASEGLRYRPLAWTLVALLAVAWYLPGRPDPAPTQDLVAAPSPVTTPSTDGTDEGPPASGAGDELVATPAFDPSPGPGFSAPLSSPRPSFTPVTPVTPVVPPSPPSADDPTTTPSEPLTVRGSGWATRLPSTPLPADEVPEESLPVANRLGSIDRVSFVRLAGDATTLELAEDEASAREVLGTAAVAVCPILVETWAEEPEQSLDDAPPWDTESCVAGTEQDGRWSFDLSSFEDRTGPAGFALVPTTDAPPDFQVAFLTS